MRSLGFWKRGAGLGVLAEHDTLFKLAFQLGSVMRLTKEDVVAFHTHVERQDLASIVSCDGVQFLGPLGIVAQVEELQRGVDPTQKHALHTQAGAQVNPKP